MHGQLILGHFDNGLLFRRFHKLLILGRFLGKRLAGKRCYEESVPCGYCVIA